MFYDGDVDNDLIRREYNDNYYKKLKLTLVDLVLLKTFQNRRVSSPAPVTIDSPSGDMACKHRASSSCMTSNCTIIPS